MSAPVVEVVPVTELRAGDVVEDHAAGVTAMRTVVAVGHGPVGTIVRYDNCSSGHPPGGVVRRLVRPGEVRAADLQPGDRVVIERTVLAVIPHADGQRLVVFAASRDEAPTLVCDAGRMLRRAQ